jgi:hypothetical protein
MYRETAKLLLYSNLGEDAILTRMAEIYRDWDTMPAAEKGAKTPALISRIYAQVKRLLDLATVYGFNHNLWQNYLTFLLMTNENSFTLTAERQGASEGSVNHFARADFAIFKRLFDFDFRPLEEDLGIDCFSVLTHYTAIPKKAHL